MNFAHLLTLGVFLLSTFNLAAQGEGNIWYFGKNLGLDFNNNPPILMTDGAMNTYEGCSSVADKDGNLLLYTDGITVWNRKHQVIEGGNDLHGHPSSTQSGIIVAKPKSTSIYYVFTVDAQEGGLEGLEYAEVDVTANDGDCKVLKKHLMLLPDATEKVTGVIHENGQDIWIVTHQWETNAFYAFLVTENGVQKEPIISKVGQVHRGKLDNSIGYLKASPSGDKIAITPHEDSRFDVFDFNNQTGEVSNVTELTILNGFGYGIEFSPSGKYLYTSTAFDGEIAQYDLTSDDLKASKAILRQADSKSIGALQIAPDGKIYYQIYGDEYLGTISKPEQKGEAALLSDEAVLLPGKVGRFGLPTFIQTYFTEANIEKNINENPITEIPESEIKKEQPFKIAIIIKEKVFKEVGNPSSGKVGTIPIYGVNVGENTLSLFGKTDKEGTWTIDGAKEQDYTVTIVQNGYFNKVLRISQAEIMERLTNLNRTATFEIELEKIYKNVEIKLDNVYYDYNSANVQTASLLVLDELANVLKQNPQIKIQLSAHTDCRGTDVYNQTLSQKRADFVVNYLISKGINSPRLKAQGYGESFPATSCNCENCSDDEHQMNRRTTFKVL
jgi:outer membrane protein OmpA-like peptidoglycan-associated protein